MLPRFGSFALAILGVVACGAESIRRSGDDGDGSGGASGTSGSGGTAGAPIACRTYASRYVLSQPGSTMTVDCRFVRETLAMVCTDDGEDPSLALTTSEIWATLEDAVTENRPIGKFKAKTFSNALVDGPIACMFRFDMSFDSLGRITAMRATPELLEGPCDANSETYDTWDSEGRPTHGSARSAGLGECFGQELDLAYDDAARSVTLTLGEGSNCLVGTFASTFDENGILTRYTADDFVAAEYTTLETAELCVD